MRERFDHRRYGVGTLGLFSAAILLASCSEPEAVPPQTNPTPLVLHTARDGGLQLVLFYPQDEHVEDFGPPLDIVLTDPPQVLSLFDHQGRRAMIQIAREERQEVYVTDGSSWRMIAEVNEQTALFPSTRLERFWIETRRREEGVEYRSARVETLQGETVAKFDEARLSLAPRFRGLGPQGQWWAYWQSGQFYIQKNEGDARAIRAGDRQLRLGFSDSLLINAPFDSVLEWVDLTGEPAPSEGFAGLEDSLTPLGQQLVQGELRRLTPVTKGLGLTLRSPATVHRVPQLLSPSRVLATLDGHFTVGRIRGSLNVYDVYGRTIAQHPVPTAFGLLPDVVEVAQAELSADRSLLLIANRFAEINGATPSFSVYEVWRFGRDVNESEVVLEGPGLGAVPFAMADGRLYHVEEGEIRRFDAFTEGEERTQAVPGPRLVRGPIGVAVAVSIRRDGVDPFTVAIERAEIVPTTVYFEDDKGLPRFRVTAFSRNTAESLAEEITKAEARTGGLPGIVLDLRGNPGGYLTQAIEVADMFLDAGVVVATHGRHPASSNNYRAHMGAVAKEKPLVLLIDGRSASASELLAAALVDAGRAAAVGSVTYGKGSIQNLEELANGGELIITWSRMHAPSGYLLDGLGVLPTVCTVGAYGGADAVIREARRNTSTAASWRAYRQPNKPEAERLRRACPKSELGGDADIAVARRLLEDRGAYEAALSPKRNPANHAAVGWRPSRAG